MPHKNPVSWETLFIWGSSHLPTLSGMLMTVAIAWLRITYAGGTGRQRLCEAVLCGLLWVPGWALLAWLGLSVDLAGPIACSIGFLGVDTLRSWATLMVDKNWRGKNDPH
ncbi:MAG: phage holin, lambda family [Aeromonas sp.]